MPETEQVDTESQRVALEEMSQALLDRLNAMVAEQEKRAAEFAERTHSLSALPQGTPLPQVVPVAVEPIARPASPLPSMPPLQPEHRAADTPSAARSVPPPPAAKPKAEPAPRQQWAPAPQQSRPKAPRGGQRQEEKSSLGSGVVVFVLVVIYFLIRACSN